MNDKAIEASMTKPFCLACNAVGMSHCAHPEDCGEVVYPISNERLEEIATEEWCEIEECNAMAKELMWFRKKRGNS